MICKPGGLKTRTMCRYNEAAKLMRRTRMNSALRQSVTQIFEELGIHIDNLYKWRKAWQLSGEVLPVSEKDHNHKSSGDEFTVVLKTAAFNMTKLGAYWK